MVKWWSCLIVVVMGIICSTIFIASVCVCICLAGCLAGYVLCAIWLSGYLAAWLPGYLDV